MTLTRDPHQIAETLYHGQFCPMFIDGQDVPAYSGAVVTVAAFVSGLGGAVIGAIGVGCVLVRRAGAPSLAAAAFGKGSELQPNGASLASMDASERPHGTTPPEPENGGATPVSSRPSEIAGRVQVEPI